MEEIGRNEVDETVVVVITPGHVVIGKPRGELRRFVDKKGPEYRRLTCFAFSQAQTRRIGQARFDGFEHMADAAVAAQCPVGRGPHVAHQIGRTFQAGIPRLAVSTTTPFWDPSKSPQKPVCAVGSFSPCASSSKSSQNAVCCALADEEVLRRDAAATLLAEAV